MALFAVFLESSGAVDAVASLLTHSVEFCGMWWVGPSREGLPDADHVVSLESCMGCLAGDSAAQAQPSICSACSLCHERCGRARAKQQQGHLCVFSSLVVLLYSQHIIFLLLQPLLGSQRNRAPMG